MNLPADRLPRRTCSTSDATSVYGCERRLALYRGGLERCVVADDDASAAGEVIHAGLAAAFLEMRADEGKILSACLREADRVGLARAPAEAWARVASRAARAFRLEEWDPIDLPGVGRLVEARFFVDHVGGGRLRGPARPESAIREAAVGEDAPFAVSVRLDAALRHRESGLAYVIDHKTKASVSESQPWADLHLQSEVYWAALEAALGEPVGGAFLYHVLREEPKAPKLNKPEKGQTRGHVSGARVRTSWELALQAIAASADPDPESERYLGWREECETRLWQLLQPVHSTPESRRVSVAHVAAAIPRVEAALVAGPAAPPTGRGRECGRCDWRDWCAEEFRGEDPSRLLGQLYRLGDDGPLRHRALDFGRGATGPAPAPAALVERTLNK